MARIRITLEDDDGREINGDKERLYDVSGGATRLVDIEAAVETLKQAVLPERTAELLTLAQHQFVAEVKKGASCVVMGHGASPSRPWRTGPGSGIWGFLPNPPHAQHDMRGVGQKTPVSGDRGDLLWGCLHVAEVPRGLGGAVC
jgi:hypothetical protein